MDPVEPIQGEPMRFMVASRREGVDPYLVDLEEFGGNGQCGCEHFQFRLQPILERGAKPSPELQCFHIEQARSYERMDRSCEQSSGDGDCGIGRDPGHCRDLGCDQMAVAIHLRSRMDTKRNEHENQEGAVVADKTPGGNRTEA